MGKRTANTQNIGHELCLLKPICLIGCGKGSFWLVKLEPWLSQYRCYT